MKTRLPTRIQRLPRRQRGVALFVALVFLVILTVIGVTALGNNSLQTRMAYGSSETNFAFQSADSVLVAGETWLANQTIKPISSCTSVVVACTDPVGIWTHVLPTPIVTGIQLSDENFWLGSGRKLGFSYVEGVTTPPQIANQIIAGTEDVPRYIIEDLGPDISGSLVQPGPQIYYYQVTARGFGAQATSRTVVQSVYAHGY